MKARWEPVNEADEHWKRRGFESYEDYRDLVWKVDLSRSTTQLLFQAWALGNGTKAGLLMILQMQEGVR